MFKHFFIGFLLAITVNATPYDEMLVDGFVAKVNDRVITVGDVMELIQPTEMQLRDLYQGDELEEKREEIFNSGRDQLIEQALILEEFKKQGVELPKQLVDNRVNEIIFDRFDNNRATFLQALTDQQITLEEWRAEIQDNLVVGYLRRQEINDKVKISPTLIWQTYLEQKEKYAEPEQVRLRMIVIHKGATTQDHAVKQKQAQTTRDDIVAGGDFAAAAKNISEGNKASEGGDWGWIEPSILRKELQDAVASLKVGDVSEVIETDADFYILKIEDHMPARFKPFDDVRKEIENELKQAEAERLYKAWIQRLKRNHYVQIF